MFVFVQEKLLELKEDQQRAEMDLKEVSKENELLKEPFNVARNTVEELTQKMANYNKDKQRLTASILGHGCQLVNLKIIGYLLQYSIYIL